MLCAVTHGWLQLVFVVACKVGVTGALVLGPLYAEELFPGNVRSAASQACSLVSTALLQLPFTASHPQFQGCRFSSVKSVPPPWRLHVVPPL